ncbi:MAG TPA: hypothetical protein VH062_07020 [Polyangiaceae bacterium]|jgi:hypothetical protein|nr:hypothetical protein [Polyangiaceae bacterium]
MDANAVIPVVAVAVAPGVRSTDELETLVPPSKTDQDSMPAPSSAIRKTEQSAPAADELVDDSEDRPTWRPQPLPPPPRAKPTMSGTFEAVPSSKRKLRQRAI